MKTILSFCLLFATTLAFSSTPSMDLSSEDAVGIKICWKGPKGNKTCITISKGLTSLKMETLDLRAGETSDGFMTLSGFPRDVDGESFLINAPQEIGDGMFVSPGKYTVQNGSVRLKFDGKGNDQVGGKKRGR